MVLSNRFGLMLALGIATAGLLGCDASPPSKAEVFKSQHQSTMTPHGPIDMDSVEEAPDGNIHYKTSDGKAWTVSAREEGDGSLRFEAPIRNDQH